MAIIIYQMRFAVSYAFKKLSMQIIKMIAREVSLISELTGVPPTPAALVAYQRVSSVQCGGGVNFFFSTANGLR